MSSMTAASDRFIVSKDETTVVRKCPFCDVPVEDVLGKDINFIVHCGSPSSEHVKKQAWADYLSFMNHI
jgi:hypothetical protein